MLQFVEKGIRGGICPATHRYSKTNNQCMQDYNKDKELSCLMYCNASTLYGWAIPQNYQ